MRPTTSMNSGGGARPVSRADIAPAEHCLRGAARRGTSTIEMVIVLPVVMLVLGLTFFFGRAWANRLHVLAADRYAAWKQVQTNVFTDSATLNSMFCNSKASPLNSDLPAEQSESTDDLISAAGGGRAGALAQQSITQYPEGRKGSVSAAFPDGVKLWQTIGLTGPISNSHCRDGVPWRHDEADCLPALKSQFLAPLDAALAAIPAPAPDPRDPNRTLSFGQVLQALYVAKW